MYVHLLLISCGQEVSCQQLLSESSSTPLVLNTVVKILLKLNFVCRSGEFSWKQNVFVGEPILYINDKKYSRLQIIAGILSCSISVQVCAYDE